MVVSNVNYYFLMFLIHAFINPRTGNSYSGDVLREEFNLYYNELYKTFYEQF